MNIKSYLGHLRHREGAATVQILQIIVQDFVQLEIKIISWKEWDIPLNFWAIYASKWEKLSGENNNGKHIIAKKKIK